MRTKFPTRQTISTSGVAGRDLRQYKTASDRDGQTADMLNSRTMTLPGTSDQLNEGHLAEAGGDEILLRFVAGIDGAARPMSVDEMNELGDMFSQSVLLAGKNPKTVRELFDALVLTKDGALQDRRLFLVAEGGQARLTRPDFEFNGRLVVTWQAAAAGSAPDIMLSTVPVADDPRALMQLIAWSTRDESFHFFERERRSGAWVWAGNSFHAIDPRSRGKGPFDSHINGSLVMKELKAPWTHWHSVSASIAPEAIPSDSELLSAPIFQRLDSAHELEPIVKAAVRRWTRSRIRRSLSGKKLHDLPDYLKQVLWCTSVNLVSSTRVIGQPENGNYPLPPSFFVDFDALAFLSEELAEAASLLPAARLEVPAALYESAIASADIGILEDGGDGTRLQGDTHFAFLVPERAFEDFIVVQQLVTSGVLGARTALCLLLIDFQNPVFSPDRAALLKHVPPDVATDGGADFDARLRASIGSPDPASPEAKLMGFLNDPDIVGTARHLLADFFANLQARLKTPEGAADLVRLAESRRRAFATRKLAEFRSTLAMGRDPPGHLAMAADGALFVKGSKLGEGEK